MAPLEAELWLAPGPSVHESSSMCAILVRESPPSPCRAYLSVSIAWIKLGPANPEVQGWDSLSPNTSCSLTVALSAQKANSAMAPRSLLLCQWPKLPRNNTGRFQLLPPSPRIEYPQNSQSVNQDFCKLLYPAAWIGPNKINKECPIRSGRESYALGDARR